jgi:hypothetical protein
VHSAVDAQASMKPLLHLVLLLAAHHSIQGSLAQHTHSPTSLSTSHSTAAYSLRELQQEDSQPNEAQAAADLHSSSSSSSSSAAFAVPAKSTCRINNGLTNKCDPSCYICDKAKLSKTDPPRPKYCRCCKPGSFLAPGLEAVACSPCPAGQWGPGYGLSACRKCPRNMVSLKPGSTVCDGELHR